MKPLRVLVGVGVLFVSLGCVAAPVEEAPPEIDDQAELEAINGIVGQWVDAFNNQDADALTNLFAEDGMRMPPAANSFSGHTRIRSEWEAQFEQGAGTIVVNLEETVKGTELAFSRGTWAVTTQPEEGDATSVVGKWVNLMKRQDDGSWKILRNIWNLEEPTA